MASRFTYRICVLVVCLLAAIVVAGEVQAIPDIPCGSSRSFNFDPLRPLVFRLSNVGTCDGRIQAYELPGRQGALLLDVTVPAGVTIEVNRPSEVSASILLSAQSSGPDTAASFRASALIQNTSPAAQFFARSGDSIYSTNLENVGIGTVQPETKLHVQGQVTASGFVGDGSRLTGIRAVGLDSPMGGPRDVVAVDASGNLGIGTTAPEAEVDIRGTVRLFGGRTGLELGLTYTAESDGFVFAWHNRGASQSFNVFVGGSEPLGLVAESLAPFASFTIPIRKGENFRVVASGPSARHEALWIRLGER